MLQSGKRNEQFTWKYLRNYLTSSGSRSTQKMSYSYLFTTSHEKTKQSLDCICLTYLFTDLESCHIEMWPRNFSDYCGCAHLYQGTRAVQGRSWSFQYHFSCCFTQNTLRVDHQPTKRAMPYASVSPPLWDRGPVNYFFIRRGPVPNKFTHKYFSKFFKFVR